MTHSLYRNRSFMALTTAQFLGAANDNLFKIVVSLFSVEALQSGGGSSYLSLTGALFAVPYLLFSGYAGHLADSISKRTVLIFCKAAEILVMMAGLFALRHAHWVEGLLFILFLMAAHSAFFSPAKYAAVPEIVARTDLTRANGILEASRYAAIILGTAAGGILMEVWRPTPEWIGATAILIAALGFFCSTRIAPLKPASAHRTFPKNPWKSLNEGVRKTLESRSLTLATVSLTLFDAIATLTLLDVLLIGKVEIGLSDAASGSVGAFAALGAGLGAFLCGYVFRNKAALGVTPIAGLGVSVSLLGLGFQAHSYWSLGIWLFILGVFSGLFVVPFVAWLQKAARSDEKGLIISTANFVDMAGVLGASLVLALLHDGFGFGPKTILIMTGIGMLGYLVVLFLVWKRLSSQVAILLRGLIRGEKWKEAFTYARA